MAGRLVHLGRYPGLLPALSGEQMVIGDLYELPEGGAVLEELDRYEGCHAEDAEPHEYRRILATVTGERELGIRCWTYLFEGEAGESPLIASGDWLRDR